MVAATFVGQFNPVDNDINPLDNTGTIALVLPLAGNDLYRARAGDPDRGTPPTRIVIERNVTQAAAQLGIIDFDPDGDGWALVGRSGRAGTSGPIASFRIASDGTPVVSTRHPRKGCIDLAPPTLDVVRSGQTRLLAQRAKDTTTCRREDPGADVDQDGQPDNQQPLYRVRNGDPALNESPNRFYVERSTVGWDTRRRIGLGPRR
jgi:hypothetical protein